MQIQGRSCPPHVPNMIGPLCPLAPSSGFTPPFVVQNIISAARCRVRCIRRERIQNLIRVFARHAPHGGRGNKRVLPLNSGTWFVVKDLPTMIPFLSDLPCSSVHLFHRPPQAERLTGAVATVTKFETERTRAVSPPLPASVRQTNECLE